MLDVHGEHDAQLAERELLVRIDNVADDLLGAVNRCTELLKVVLAVRTNRYLRQIHVGRERRLDLEIRQVAVVDQPAHRRPLDDHIGDTVTGPAKPLAVRALGRRRGQQPAHRGVVETITLASPLVVGEHVMCLVREPQGDQLDPTRQRIGAPLHRVDTGNLEASARHVERAPQFLHVLADDGLDDFLARDDVVRHTGFSQGHGELAHQHGAMRHRHAVAATIMVTLREVRHQFRFARACRQRHDHVLDDRVKPCRVDVDNGFVLVAA